MLYQPTIEPLTIDQLAAQYCECLMALEALDIAERGDWCVPEEAAYERERLTTLKLALGDEMRRRVLPPKGSKSVQAEPPLSLPDF